MRFQAAYSTPPVVKNLIILNALFFLAEMVLPAGAGDWMIRGCSTGGAAISSRCSS